MLCILHLIRRVPRHLPLLGEGLGSRHSLVNRLYIFVPQPRRGYPARHCNKTRSRDGEGRLLPPQNPPHFFILFSVSRRNIKYLYEKNEFFVDKLKSRVYNGGEINILAKHSKECDAKL